MKYLLFGLVAYLAWRWFSAQRPSDEPAVPPSPPSPPPQTGGIEKMIGCAQCGVYLPQSEAVAGPDSLHFCSDEHRRHYLSQRTS